MTNPQKFFLAFTYLGTLLLPGVVSATTPRDCLDATLKSLEVNEEKSSEIDLLVNTIQSYIPETTFDLSNGALCEYGDQNPREFPNIKEYMLMLEDLKEELQGLRKIDLEFFKVGISLFNNRIVFAASRASKNRELFYGTHRYESDPMTWKNYPDVIKEISEDDEDSDPVFSGVYFEPNFITEGVKSIVDSGKHELFYEQIFTAVEEISGKYPLINFVCGEDLLKFSNEVKKYKAWRNTDELMACFKGIVAFDIKNNVQTANLSTKTHIRLDIINPLSYLKPRSKLSYLGTQSSNFLRDKMRYKITRIAGERVKTEKIRFDKELSMARTYCTKLDALYDQALENSHEECRHFKFVYRQVPVVR